MPDAGTGYTDIREKVMQDSLDGLIAAGLARGDDAINETPEEWQQAARLALRMHLLLKERDSPTMDRVVNWSLDTNP